MAEVRTAKPVDLSSFPGCAHVIDNTPPIAQCQEAEITGAAGAITNTENTITDVGAFAGVDLAGKEVVVTLPAGEAGTYAILSNTDDVIVTDNSFGVSDGAVGYAVHDVGQAYLTRNESSFIRYIQANSGAFTKVNGQVYTDLADPPLNAACSDTWAPV